jgi:hypothetical protein
MYINKYIGTVCNLIPKLRQSYQCRNVIYNELVIVYLQIVDGWLFQEDFEVHVVEHFSYEEADTLRYK